MVMRRFEDAQATRGRVPFSFGIAGATGSGKTYSALRIGEGMRRVFGGQTFVIDTEAGRALKYQKYFSFRHVHFGAPHGPFDYLAAVKHCADAGASVVIIDSMTHEHEGVGGVREIHAAELQRLVKRYPNSTEEKLTATAWVEAKRQRRAMINGILQLPVVVIYCFRAQHKEHPVKLGWCPIGGREIFFELDALCMLPPDADGCAWWGNEPGKRSGMKAVPKQFRALFNQGEQLSEELGESMARWSLGGPVTVFEQILDAMEGATTLEELNKVAPMVKAAKEARTINPSEHRGLQARYVQRKAFIERGDGFESDEQAAEARAKDDAFERAVSGKKPAAPAPDPASGEVRPEDEPPVAEG